MDPFTRSAAEMDEMAENLRRLNTGGSRSSGASRDPTSPRQERQQPRRIIASNKVSSGGGYGGFPYTQPVPPHVYTAMQSPQQESHVTGNGTPAVNGAFGGPWHPGDVYDDDDLERLRNWEAPPSRPLRTPPARPSFSSGRKDSVSRVSERRPSQPPSTPTYNLFPPADPPLTKPLPPLPRNPRRLPSAHSFDMNSSRRAPSLGSLEAKSDGTSSIETSRFSQSSNTTSNMDRASNGTSPPLPAPSFPPPAVPEERPRGPPLAHGALHVKVVPWKTLFADDKHTKALKDKTVYFFDLSTSSTSLASKHGNNIINIWSVGSGVIQSTIKVSCYTTAQSRSREYFVRSHAILSETASLMAISAGFGDTLEIWDWSKRKRLQTIDQADRWAAVRSNMYETGWSSLVAYRGSSNVLDLYGPTHNPKKPFRLSRSIDLANSGLPIIPKYPELAFSATGPLLITASGPRPPRPGHPPPERETILTAWEIHDRTDNITPTTPYKVVTPWQHTELDTALPSGLATYGSVAVSIWIPASYRAVPVPAARGGQGFNLAPVPVPYRYVLVWDFSASSTRTFRIPNATSCVSPDCRFVAYCDASGTDVGARGCIVILDAMSGKRLWCWPDPDAGASQSGPQMGFELLENLSRVSELAFSSDGGFMFIGTADGEIGIFDVREVGNIDPAKK
ncbi:hypothetical protein B0T22DRAFT_281195 [Podospora appendiculata]|uniref:WD40 repeat-like protein n=1 Tax=Podospora appendiculata TaxID=314037 RepID=A0AAE0X0K2_9PEZI|nr:hypothetical protein B0T22DRAFT_281195 [Podospora appendiculata]